MKVEKFFAFKDRVKNKLDRGFVVYSIRCKTCGQEYVSKTARILKLRVDEHRANTTGNQSALHRHGVEHGHEIDYDGVEVIDMSDI